MAVSSTSAGFTAICATFAVGFLVMGLRGIAFARRARGWPTVVGTITRSRIAREYRAKLVHAAHVDVEYRYEVGGQAHTGTRVSFESDAGDTKRIADVTLARYREGERAQVFFNPGNPADCVLEPGNTHRPRQALFFAIVAGAVGALVLATDLFAAVV